MKSFLLGFTSLVLGISSAYADDCASKPLRSTLLYVDENSFSSDDSLWPLEVSLKVTGSLISGESLTLFELDSGNGKIQQIWHECLPDKAKDDNSKFSTDLEKTLQGIYDNKKIQAFDAKNPPTRIIYKPLVDSVHNLIVNKDYTSRVILFSNLAENNSNGSVFQRQSDSSPDQVDLVNSIFYFFGVGNDVNNDPKYFNKAKSFWQNGIASNGGIFMSADKNLILSDSKPSNTYIYQVQVVSGTDTLNGKMNLLVDNEGNLVDSWIGISQIAGAPLSGSFVCAQGECLLHADTIGPLLGYDSSEGLLLNGKNASQLNGKIKVTVNTSVDIEVMQKK